MYRAPIRLLWSNSVSRKYCNCCPPPPPRCPPPPCPPCPPPPCPPCPPPCCPPPCCPPSCCRPCCPPPCCPPPCCPPPPPRKLCEPSSGACRPPIPPNPCVPIYPEQNQAKKYKYLTLFVCFPLIGLVAYNAFSNAHHHCKTECRAYEYMYVRNHPFPWKDGVKSLFHNDKVNHLPGECVTPPPECDLELDPKKRKVVTICIFPSISTEMDSKAVATAIAGFSTRFCNELEKNKSVVSSPLSAEILLGLLALGSEEPAQSELYRALGLPDAKSIRSAFSSVSKKATEVKGVTLNVANKVYLKEGDYELVPQLKDDAVKVFNSAFEKVYFADGAAAANKINTWVESKTNQRIKDLIKATDLGENTRLVLVNALYFKGTWKKQFNPKLTSDMPFHVTNNTTIQAPFMYKEDQFKYGESQKLNAQILEMDYVGEQTSMVIILPNEVEGLSGVLSKLASGHDLISELTNLRRMKVQVSLPKFKIETEIDLNTLLPKLGIRAIFDARNSGLTNILTNKEPLYVSKAIQKAFIEVNEEGAEAAAATGMVMMLRSMPAPTPRFRADRPFFYALVGPDQTPLFLGTYYGDE